MFDHALSRASALQAFINFLSQAPNKLAVSFFNAGFSKQYEENGVRAYMNLRIFNMQIAQYCFGKAELFLLEIQKKKITMADQKYYEDLGGSVAFVMRAYELLAAAKKPIAKFKEQEDIIEYMKRCNEYFIELYRQITTSANSAPAFQKDYIKARLMSLAKHGDMPRENHRIYFSVVNRF